MGSFAPISLCIEYGTNCEVKCVSLSEYRRARKDGSTIAFTCKRCGVNQGGVEASTILYGRDEDQPSVLDDATTFMYGRDDETDAAWLDVPPVLEPKVPTSFDELCISSRDTNPVHDIDNRDVDDQPEPQERTIEGDDDDINDTILPEQPIEFEIFETGSKRGGRLLVSSDGHSYGVKRQNVSWTLWSCSVRSKAMRCHATVRQVGDSFDMGQNDHCHPGDIRLGTKILVRTKTRSIDQDQVFRHATDIMEEVELNEIPPEALFLKPKTSVTKRAINRFRSSMRPREPRE